MPGESGFQFLESIEKEKYSILFVTAHDEYAVRAFKTNAVDYLLKPVIPEELKETITRLEHLHRLKIENQNLNSTKKSFITLEEELEH